MTHLCRQHRVGGICSAVLGLSSRGTQPPGRMGRRRSEISSFKDVRFLYMLILAVDANFRLKNRIRTNEIDDPSLGPGWGYWVELTKYKRHLKKYINEKEISTCIAFAALLQKDTRLTTGLRISGVGGCVCARHEYMRPNGLGDLQKGESLGGRETTISYDIACQWRLHVAECMPNLPQELCLPLDKIKVQYTSTSVARGGRTTRTVKMRIALASRFAGGEMNNHNHLKNVGQGDALRCRLLIAIAERNKQITAFQLVNSTVEKEVKIEWRRLIKNWHADPYFSEYCPTETQVRLEVRKDEDTLTAGGKAPLHGRSATAFLVAGIQIEDAQYVIIIYIRQRIIAELKGTVLVAVDHENRIQEWHHALLIKIGKFRSLQKIYMPGTVHVLDELEGKWDTEAPALAAEKVKLFMPNEMTLQSANDTLRGCVPGLVEMEAKLRVAQCNNSLSSRCARLHAKHHLIHFRNSNVMGQIQSTKARMLIDQVGEQVELYANCHRQGHKALEALKGSEAYPHLRPLRTDNVQLDGNAGESDAAARKKLAMISAGRGARAAQRTGDVEATIHVQWSRVLARKTRWCEEVMLLREEMRRVLRYLAWQAQWWWDQVDLRDDVMSELAAGLRGYALKQAAWHERLAEFFRKKWDVPAVTVAQHLLAEEGLDHLFSLE
ncbi:hypothetical protein B0H14DRAFT_2642530 [Mycena olivaceomarginata]|nr:hypothetical protein B0H14DRAFT_2642530 [Mycena olivaceomarginata]